MKKTVLIIICLFNVFGISAQNFTWGIDWSLKTTVKIKHDVIFIDTAFNNGFKFYLKDLKEDYVMELPALFLELKTKNKFFLGSRVLYAKKQYKFSNDAGYFNKSDFAYVDFYQTKTFNTRVYAGKEFLANKRIKPWISIGYSNYRNVNHYFDDETDATLKYDATNYVNWLNTNFKSVHALSLGAGFKWAGFGIYAYYDRNLKPINEYMHQFTSYSYFVMKADLGAKNVSRHIKTYDEETGTKIKQRPYLKQNAVGISIEHAFSSGFNLAKDTVTGFLLEYGGLEEPESIEGGYAFDGYLSMEIRKRAKTKFAPQISVYYEKSLKESSAFYLRHAVSWRYFDFVYENAAKNYQEWLYITLSNDQSIKDFSYNELDIINRYSAITNEHKIGYRFLSSSRPNYFVLNAGVRLNWRLKHWNNFTAKVRFINPTAVAGILYKSNRFSIGVNAENSIISPDKHNYYKNFFSYNFQINYDLVRWDKN